MAVIWAISAGAPPWQVHPGRSRLDAGFLLGGFLARLFRQREWGEVEKTSGAQLIDTGQLLQAVEPEMDEKTGCCHPEERPAGAGAPALGADPAGLHQRVDRPFAESDCPELMCSGLGQAAQIDRPEGSVLTELDPAAARQL